VDRECSVCRVLSWWEKSCVTEEFQVVSCRLLLVDVVKWSARIVGSLFIPWEDDNEHVLQFPSAMSCFVWLS